MINKSTKKRVVFFTDSLGFPREFENDESRINYEETYAAKIKDTFSETFEVIQQSYIGLDTEEAKYIAKFSLYPLRPDYVIFHHGVNDCAPRLFQKDSLALKIIKIFDNFLKGLVQKVVNKLSRYFSSPKRTYVDIENFEKNIREIKASLKNSNSNVKVIHISVSKKPRAIEIKRPGYNKNVEKYNSILEQYSDFFIDLDDLEEHLIGDGVHLNYKGHDFIFKKLEKILRCVE